VEVLCYVIEKTKEACKNEEQNIEELYPYVRKMFLIGISKIIRLLIFFTN